MSINKSLIIGNLARDPESRKVGDNSVCRLVLAVNDQYSKEEKVSYIDVEAWGKLAELCQQYLTKGRQAGVEGRLVQDRWEKDGKTMSKLYVKADNVQFLGSRESQDTNNSSPDQGGEDVPF